MSALLKSLRRTALLGTEDELPDARLVQLFAVHREEAAFEALLRRHGPMVLGVCRRVLGNEPDAEDAFQATFLVLVRKASALRSGEALASWLYSIAYRTARKAQAMTAKRRNKERLAPPRRACGPADGPWDELVEHLDTELSRLPEKYRAPVVLCELEGKSRKEAARLLHLAEGTLSWRLARARKLLAERLARYGVALPVGVVAVLLAGNAAEAGIPRALFAGTARAAVQAAGGRVLKAGVVSAQVIALTEGVMKTMFLMKLKVVCVLAVILALGAGGVGWSYRAAAAPPTGARDGARAARSVQDELEELRLEVAALRKGLETTRQRVKELENEVLAAKETARSPALEKPKEAAIHPDGRKDLEVVMDFTAKQATKGPVILRLPTAPPGGDRGGDEAAARPPRRQAGNGSPGTGCEPPEGRTPVARRSVRRRYAAEAGKTTIRKSIVRASPTRSRWRQRGCKASLANAAASVLSR